MVDISGTVTDKDGNPLSNVSVIVIDEVNDAVAATTTTDSSGDYSVSVGSNTYHVLFQYESSGEDYNSEQSKPSIS